MKIPAAPTMTNEDPFHILAIEPKPQGCTLLLDDGRRIPADETALALISGWCLKFGSSLSGRQDAARYYLGRRIEKPPVLISETSGRIFVRLGDYWLCYNTVLSIGRESAQGTEILLDGGQKVTVNGSARAVGRQLKRCQKYLSLLHEAFE